MTTPNDADRDFGSSDCSSSLLIKSEIHKAKSGRYDALWDDDTERKDTLQD